MNICCFHDHCCGCGECSVVCPVNAIVMRENEQGFSYPVVDEKKCVDCSLCVQHCSFNENRNASEVNVCSAYAAKHQIPSIRNASRSGGIFTALTDTILAQGGVVYGCKLLGCDRAVHARATTEIERNEFRGSKYIQSDLQAVYAQVLDDLQEDRWVLFSGTPCQVSAIADYCKGTNSEKLLLVDIVCHGVPSTKIWSDYLAYVKAQNNNREIKTVDFRDKKRFGWAAHRETIEFSDGMVYSNTYFRQLFYKHLILRKECFECPYKNLNRAGDISLADAWGITEHYPSFDDNLGVSLVLLNSPKGQKIFDALKDVEQIEVDLTKLMQPCLKENWKRPDDYERFWRYYVKHSFKQVIDKYVIEKVSILVRFKNKVRRIGSRIKRIMYRK